MCALGWVGWLATLVDVLQQLASEAFGLELQRSPCSVVGQREVEPGVTASAGTRGGRTDHRPAAPGSFGREACTLQLLNAQHAIHMGSPTYCP